MNSINIPKEEFHITMEQMSDYGLEEFGILTKHWCTLPLSKMVRVWNMAIMPTQAIQYIFLPLPNQTNVYAYYDDDDKKLCTKYFEDSMHFICFLSEDWFMDFGGFEQLLEDNETIKQCYPQWYADKEREEKSNG